jgi:hypothetical protein
MEPTTEGRKHEPSAPSPLPVIDAALELATKTGSRRVPGQSGLYCVAAMEEADERSGDGSRNSGRLSCANAGFYEQSPFVGCICVLFGVATACDPRASASQGWTYCSGTRTPVDLHKPTACASITVTQPHRRRKCLTLAMEQEDNSPTAAIQVRDMLLSVKGG